MLHITMERMLAFTVFLRDQNVAIPFISILMAMVSKDVSMIVMILILQYILHLKKYAMEKTIIVMALLMIIFRTLANLVPTELVLVMR